MKSFSFGLRRILLPAILGWGLVSGTAFAAGYQVHNLVSDGGVPADHQDVNLVNGWGITSTATSPMWVSDNGTGKATLYDGLGNILSLVVIVPASANAQGAPTGVVSNGSTDFVVHSGTLAAPARFIFAAEDGFISGWSPTVDATHAIHAAFMTDAVYKGLTIASNNGANMLYAANFHAHRIDVFRANFTPVKIPGGFVDPTIPSNFSPFNILALGGKLYVSYAQKEEDGNDEVHGPGLGIVDEYDTGGHLLRRIATGGTLNAPWGMAIAPAGFGEFSGRLLVGNFGDGTVNAYDLTSATFQGQLKTPAGIVIAIDGLWGIIFGNNANNQPTTTLFFAAGPNGESNGLYGRIDAVASSPPQ
jgi:uncharacterized protein (TIGR03118 family)